MENEKNLSEQKVNDLDDDDSTSSLKSWVIAIIVTAVAIYAIPTLIGMIM